MISLIIPAYNEEDAVGETVRKAHKALEQYEGYEIIVVNDCSSDNTAEKALRAGAKVLNQPRNWGYGHAIKQGIKSSKNKVIAISDADGTYPIEMISTLVSYMHDHGFDMVIGARKQTAQYDNWLKRPSRRIFTMVSEFACGQKIDDINSGLRVFDKGIAMKYLYKFCDTFSFTTDITLTFALNGFSIKYLPIDYYRRVGKSKVRHFRDSLRTAQIVFENIAVFNPMKIFLVLTLFSLIFTVGGVICIFFERVSGILIICTGIFTSLLMVALGFLAVAIKGNHFNRRR